MTTLGAFGETWAVAYLQRHGYRIVERNVRFREGEIDIVARDGTCLVFVEVKSRRSAAYGSPESSMTTRRFARLAAAIQRYVQQRELEDADYRIDVVALEVSAGGRVEQVRLLQNVAAPAS